MVVKRKKATLHLSLVVLAVVAVVAVALGILWSGVLNARGSAKEYDLTLVILPSVQYNSSLAQPSYFVLHDGILLSASNITVPSRTLVKLTIIDYDSGGDANLSTSFTRVQGTVGGIEEVVNGTPGAMIPRDQLALNVTSLPASIIAHTFTVPQLGINIPVPSTSVVIAYLYFNQTGTYTWQCMVPCGAGNGYAGAMDTPGWMLGQITVI
jgi:hypothetical protein